MLILSLKLLNTKSNLVFTYLSKLKYNIWALNESSFFNKISYNKLAKVADLVSDIINIVKISLWVSKFDLEKVCNKEVKDKDL